MCAAVLSDCACMTMLLSLFVSATGTWHRPLEHRSEALWRDCQCMKHA